jgi:hypothetical protein
MRMHARIWLAAALLLIVPSFTFAQRAPGISRSSMSAGVSAPAAAPVSHTMLARTRASTNHSAGTHVAKGTSLPAAGSSAGVNTFGSGGDGLTLQQLLDPYPANGFSFAHLAAIDRDLDMKAFIDPATQVRIAEARRRMRRVPRLGNGGFYLLDGGAYAIPEDPNGAINADQDAQTSDQQMQDQEGLSGQELAGHRQTEQQAQQQEQQPIISIQQPAVEANNAMIAQEDVDPLPDEGEFTLVLRSGREIEAVAFTRVNDKIIYITSGGSRRTLALADVDSEATVRLNQERGTPLQLPL